MRTLETAYALAVDTWRHGQSARHLVLARHPVSAPLERGAGPDPAVEAASE